MKQENKSNDSTIQLDIKAQNNAPKKEKEKEDLYLSYLNKNSKEKDQPQKLFEESLEYLKNSEIRKTNIGEAIKKEEEKEKEEKEKKEKEEKEKKEESIKNKKFPDFSPIRKSKSSTNSGNLSGK